METLLFYLHYALLLIFGTVLSAAFAGVVFSRTNLLRLGLITALCGALQYTFFSLWGEVMVWKLYPLLTHLPLGLGLVLLCRRRWVTVICSVATAYLCCQPSNWMGLLMQTLVGPGLPVSIAQTLSLILFFAVLMLWLVRPLSQLYKKDLRSTMTFCVVPLVYYVFDYVVGTFTGLWYQNSLLVMEFVPTFLCLSYLAFCSAYCRVYEQKADAERGEQMIAFKLEHQAKEIETVRRIEQELRLQRHDMRLFLSNLGACLEADDIPAAQKMIAGFSGRLSTAAIHRYCTNDILNYVLNDFAFRCREASVYLDSKVELTAITHDEVMLATILSNLLDNALNAQLQLPEERRSISLLFKSSNQRLLLSLRNPCAEMPVFVKGLPLSNRSGHGYGVQSIRTLTERLGGKCQFTTEKDIFVVRIIL